MARKKISFIADTGATFSLLTSYSGPTQNSELTIKGVSSCPEPKNQPPISLSIWKLDPRTLISHNASVPHGAPRERFVTQIRGVYYHTPSQCGLCSTCRWHLDPLNPLLLTFPGPIHRRPLSLGYWSPIHSQTYPSPYHLKGPLSYNRPTTVLSHSGGPQGT